MQYRRTITGERMRILQNFGDTTKHMRMRVGMACSGAERSEAERLFANAEQGSGSWKVGVIAPSHLRLVMNTP